MEKDTKTNLIEHSGFLMNAILEHEKNTYDALPKVKTEPCNMVDRISKVKYWLNCIDARDALHDFLVDECKKESQQQ